MHKGFGVFFTPGATDEAKTAGKANLAKKFVFLEQHLQGKDYLLGSAFTVADAYLFTVLGWSRIVGIDLGEWPAADGLPCTDRSCGRPCRRR